MYKCYSQVRKLLDNEELIVYSHDEPDDGWRQCYYVKLAAGDAILNGPYWASPNKHSRSGGKTEMSKEEWEKQIREEEVESGKGMIQYLLVEA